MPIHQYIYIYVIYAYGDDGGDDDDDGDDGDDDDDDDDVCLRDSRLDCQYASLTKIGMLSIYPSQKRRICRFCLVILIENALLLAQELPEMRRSADGNLLPQSKL